MTKRCSKCGREKDIKEFSRGHVGEKDGIQTYCIACISKYNQSRGQLVRSQRNRKQLKELRKRL